MAAKRTADTAEAIGNLLKAHASQPASKPTLKDVALSEPTAAIIKAMLDRGDRRADVAVYFDLCLQSVDDIASGNRFAGVQAVASNDLPTSGFCIRRSDAHRLKMALDFVSAQLDMAVKSDTKIESDFDVWFLESWLDPEA